MALPVVRVLADGVLALLPSWREPSPDLCQRQRHREPVALLVDGVLALLPSWREPLPVLARELVAVAGASHPTKGLDRGRCLICASGATVASVSRCP